MTSVPCPLPKGVGAALRPLKLLFLVFAGPLALAAAETGPATGDLWSAHVQPLLEKHCGECHNATRSKSGLDLGSLQAILKGGDRGAAVIPGRPDASNLYKFLQAGSDPHMPPKGKQLPEEEIELVKTWIQKIPVVDGSRLAAATSSPAAASPAAPAKPAPAWVPPASMPVPRVIDRYLELGWQERGVKPARVVDDAGFARRVYLDLAGRIPMPAELDRFERGGRDRRARLVDELLSGEEYVTRMREVFDVVLMGRRGDKFEDERQQFGWHAFLEDAFRRNRPWNEVVRELIVARPVGPAEKGAIWYLYERQNNAQAIAEAVAPVVFGLQIKCAQCHDHMIAREIKQAHYWGMVAAFNRCKNVDYPGGKGISESAVGGFVSFANLKKESQPAHLTFFNGRRVDEPWPKPDEKEVDSADKYLVPPPGEKEPAKAPSVPKFSRREALADAVTRDNPLLARAMVNRVWALVFGRGIVHPVELMDSKHAPSHPELLDWLARDFQQSDYDVRRLIRNLMLTRAYQLDSRHGRQAARAFSRHGVALAKSASPKPALAQPDSFSRALDKPLSAEQLYRSLLVATGNQPAADGKVVGREAKDFRRAVVAQFPDLFQTDYNASLQQALFLSNSPLIDDLLKPRGQNLTARLLAMGDPEDRVRAAFLQIFSREPDADELQTATRYLAAHPASDGVREFVWALLTSAEFQVNH